MKGSSQNADVLGKLPLLSRHCGGMLCCTVESSKYIQLVTNN